MQCCIAIILQAQKVPFPVHEVHGSGGMQPTLNCSESYNNNNYYYSFKSLQVNLIVQFCWRPINEPDSYCEWHCTPLNIVLVCCKCSIENECEHTKSHSQFKYV